jgi:hypothetical protein
MGNATRNPNYAAAGAPMDAISVNDIELQSSSSLDDKHVNSVVTEHENFAAGMVRRFARTLFHKDQLDRALERPHIAGKPVLHLLWRD